jgi:hypothetical protein
MKLITGVLLLAATTLANALANDLDTLVKTDTGWVSGSGTAVRVYKGIRMPPVRRARCAGGRRSQQSRGKGF